MNRFPRSEFTDRQVEALLMGNNDDASLATLSTALDEVRALRDLAPLEPPAKLIASVVAVAHKNRPRPTAHPQPIRNFRKLAPAAVAVALAITTFMPISVVANAAVPGSPLFALDLLLERFGIGNGGFAERLAEVETLRDRSDVEAAVRHMNDSLGSATEREVSEQRERVDTLVEELIASDQEEVNPNQGPGNNSGNDNPNQGPGNNSGNGGNGKSEDNPNKGSGNSSGSGKP